MPMEAKEIFEANSKNVRELLSERNLGLYIPPYQRPYGWDKDKVTKLVSDTLHGYSKLLESDESYTFLGTVITIHDINFSTIQPVVRTDVPAKVLTVIDGQQRLTTLLAYCVALHNQIRLAHFKLTKNKKPEQFAPAEAWLDGQARQVVDGLQSTFMDEHTFGESPRYPRMIRSFADQWSRSKQHAKYNSPIAHLLFSYAALVKEEKPTEFKPTKRLGVSQGEEALVDRYTQIVKLLKALDTDPGNSDIEPLPDLKEISYNSKFQQALLNHEFPPEVKAAIQAGTVSEEFSRLLQLVLIASYSLGRVALTVVRGKNEDFAFTIFESLNTTGEPLTAYETFKPRVVMAETLEKFESSNNRRYLDEVSDYLSGHGVGEPLQDATRDLLISFASAETGTRLSKRLADQRKYLKEEFERYDADQQERESFVKHLRDVAHFSKSAWVGRETQPVLANLPIDATSDTIKLCLGFLTSLKHSVTIAPIVRFYSMALEATDEDAQRQRVSELEAAIKAITAFSVLWRATRRGTANIDQQYRELMAGSGADQPLARKLITKREKDVAFPRPAVDVVWLKEQLRARLKNSGGIASKEDFVREGSLVPAYRADKVARFILLAAYDDAVADPVVQGLIVKGKKSASPCLTYAGYVEDRHFSLEHIAPQTFVSDNGWEAKLYENKETIDKFGNLVLVPFATNAMLSNRSWADKRVLYSALGAASQSDANKVLVDAKQQYGIEFGESTQSIVSNSRHLPQVASLGLRAQEWTVDFVDQRSARVLGLAWDTLSTWLD